MDNHNSGWNPPRAQYPWKQGDELFADELNAAIANAITLGGQLSVATITDTPPVAQYIGQLWFDSSNPQLYVWYDDGTSAQWVIATAYAGGLTSDAPSDGQTYGRQNGAWLNIAAGGGYLSLAAGGTVAGATTFSSTLAFGSGAAIGTSTGNIATPKLDITGSGTNIGYQINTKGTGTVNARYVDIADNANGQGVFDNTVPLNVHWNPNFTTASGNAILAQSLLQGTITSGIANVYAFNVNADIVNAAAVGGLSNVYAGLSVTGSTAVGHRNGVVGYVNVTAVTGNTTGPGVFFTGVAGRGEASAPDTSSHNNALFGGLLASRLNSAAATGWGGQTGLEIDVSSIAGSSVSYKIGMQIVREAFDAVQGTLFDCAFGIANQLGASKGWLQGISFGEPNGVWGMDPLSTLIGSHTTTLGGPAYLAASGVDFTGVTFSGSAFKSPGFAVDGSGNVGMARAGFNGTAPVAKPTLTGAKGSNAALASVIAALVAYGLATDTTTA